MYVDNEIHPEPLGKFMLDYFHNNRNEWANVDYKLTVDISRKSDFAKIAEDIFSMANWGGGWLLFGYSEISSRKIVPVGLDEKFSADQATIQEKFNSYCNQKIVTQFTTFERIVIEDDESKVRLFAALYIAPSSSILKPIKDGWYLDERTQQKKFVFKKDDILTRRGTQNMIANERELIDIQKRIENEEHRISFLSGIPDSIHERLTSNLLPLTKLPNLLYKAKLIARELPFSEIGHCPYVKLGGNVYSFCDLSIPPFKRYFNPNSQTKLKSEEFLRDQDTQNIVIRLMNQEVISALRTRQLSYDYKSQNLFFECEGESRTLGWGLPGIGKPRIVSRFLRFGKKKRCRHSSARFRFQVIGNKFYLRVNPGIILSKNGKTPRGIREDGTIVTSLLRRRHNRSYYLDLQFWLSYLPRTSNNDFTICINRRFTISPYYICSDVNRGISHDRPANEQKHGIPISKGELISTKNIEEPLLVFGNGKEDSDPRLGLKYLGPYHQSNETPLQQMKIGIIATGSTLNLAKDFINMLAKATESGSTNHFLFPDFPGINSESKVNCKITTSDSWNETITQADIKSIIEKAQEHPERFLKERIAKAVNLYVGKIANIAMEDSPPDVILCIVPQELNRYCGISPLTQEARKRSFSKMEKEFAQAKDEGQKTLIDYGVEDVLPKNFDLRNAVKGSVMQYGVPIQFLQETKARDVLNFGPKATVQDPATFSWNIGSAMYYKCNGKPWRLAKLEEGTCYIGIAFYRSRLDPREHIQASMAQVFTSSGDGFVLRGQEVLIDKETKEPHLTEENAYDLVSRAIEQYSSKVKTNPSRVVVHKSSSFSSEERKGVVDAIGSASADLVGIRIERDIRFVRTGRYPVIRGTLIQLKENTHLLYTSGYVPRLRTYPGHRIPVPLNLQMDCDSSPQIVAEEILKLTKINWNTAAFADKFPITITFPRQVGKVLSELPEGSTIQNHYRFYM